jgi:hypothetical protein
MSGARKTSSKLPGKINPVKNPIPKVVASSSSFRASQNPNPSRMKVGRKHIPESESESDDDEEIDSDGEDDIDEQEEEEETEDEEEEEYDDDSAGFEE